MDQLTRRLQHLMDAMNARMHSSVRGSRLTVQIGRWIGPAFLLCFATGMFSHYLQDPGDFPVFSGFPVRPVWIYQLMQGLHVTSGIAAIPLLLAKLWSVYPALLRWPPIRGLRDAAERGSIALFVAASLVELAIGLVNTYKWYPWPFPFRQTHYWLAWIVMGSLILHLALKLPVIVQHWRRPRPRDPQPTRTRRASPGRTLGWSRRGFLTGIGLASAALVMTTAGQSFSWLSFANLFAPRSQGQGPQGVPVNRTAEQAQVAARALDPRWRLHLSYHGQELALSLPQLRAMTLVEYELPVACVEGWSQNARWRGVPVREVLALVGAPADSVLRFSSLEPAGNYREMLMPAAYAQDEQTLLALELNGAVLDLDHGYPVRVMAPGRPGVLQTKWLERIEVVS
ncbi:molybdopterin-dependent oxidoreductase [Psychromicrobium xiongbiense]|uniref:molybdopterin-dependent oxidoreductase n=1 Tax=Psychromicrobium xiongbiense TaxID=3051184 RepID=UPI0025537223|nr:molybdopterin-dependent oxidoreductase [Psychromicrobium sp. YIM S02556]